MIIFQILPKNLYKSILTLTLLNMQVSIQDNHFDKTIRVNKVLY